MAKNSRIIDLRGKRFGMWSVKAQAGNASRGGALWLCRCDCGTERSVPGSDLRKGKSASCGCMHRSRLGDAARTHAKTGTRLHQTWKNMRGRCGNGNRAQFKNYGGRGIAVCADWGDFAVFERWALSAGYSDDLTIERKDVNGDYCPDNCTWIGGDRQAANRRFVSRAPDGELWWHKARANGITWSAYQWRISDGWPMALAVSWPLGRRRVARERDCAGRFV